MKQALVILTALALGAMARDVFITRAQAEEDALHRSDVTAMVRAMEKQVEATKDVARAVKDAGRCR